MQSIFKGAIYSKLLGVILCFPLLTLGAKEIKYKVADIPKELRENARSVVRYDVSEFEITSIGKATFKTTYAITILNKNGIDDALFVQAYDKFSRVSGISGRIYDENGEQVKRIPSDEIEDYSAISGYSIYEDNRVKVFDPKYRTVPFTMEFTYEKSFHGIFDYPGWTPMASPYHNISTEYSSYKVIVPNNIGIRYKELNLATTCTKSPSGDKTIYFWEARNIKALIDEPYRVPAREFIPIVEIAPIDFEIEGYSGKLSSWQSFGTWISELNKGKNILTEEVKSELQRLVKDAKTDADKVKILYEYMQGKTRYVSVQVGIGGWQPFEASTVHRLSYGDCKALSNYMKAILEAVGVESKYMLVQAGGYFSDLMVDFPSSQFNHAFLCVPQKTDTIWLECTSQRVPCGYIGDFTDDRDVLLIDGENSKVVHTKAYTADDNTESRISYVKLTSVNGGEATVNANYKGLNYEQILPIYLSDDADKKRRIQNRISLPGFQLNTYAYTEHKAIIPSFDETLKLSFSNYGTASGQRVFLPLNFMNRLVNLPERVRNRKTDVLIRRPFTEIDTVVYELPANCEVEVLPAPVEIKTQFGIYTSKAEKVEGKLKYIRYYRLNKGKYPPTAYVDLLDFFEKISTADRLQCSLVSK